MTKTMRQGLLHRMKMHRQTIEKAEKARDLEHDKQSPDKDLLDLWLLDIWEATNAIDLIEKSIIHDRLAEA